MRTPSTSRNPLRGPLIAAATVLIVLVASCGSSDGTRPSISLTLPPDATIVNPAPPSETDAAAPRPAETVPPAAETAAPEPTAAPETAAPETPAPEQPAETAAPGAEPSDTVAPADDGGGTMWWPWVLLAIAVILVVVAIARRRRPSTSWPLQATTLLDEIDQLTTHLAALTPSGLQAVSQSDAMRLATMRASLGTVVEGAPNPFNKAAMNKLSAPLAALHGAVDAIAMSGADPAAPPVGSSVSQLATELHTISASVRAELPLHP